MKSGVSLSSLAFLFIRLGLTGFGGPAAHIAMMQDEVVKRRGWLTDQEFLDLVGACNLIPGPNSTELAIHIGHRQAGLPGLIVAGLSFILPAATIVLGLAALYQKYAQLPVTVSVLAAIKPIIIAIILQALLSLSKSALKDRFLKILCLACFGACYFVSNELVLILIGGSLSLLRSVGWTCLAGIKGQEGKTIEMTAFCCALICFLGCSYFAISGGAFTPGQFPLSQQHALVNTMPFSLSGLFWYFFKIGSILYGSGYVLLAFLRADLVESWHWLTLSQLLDATIVGQVTPGPVFTTATFIGYLLGGTAGALLATIGIFLPAFLFVSITAPIFQKLRQSIIASAIMDGINVCSLSLMAFVLVQLSRDCLTQPLYIAECIFALPLLMRFRINSTWLIVAGAFIGLVLGKN